MQLPIGALDLLTKGNKGIAFIHLSNNSFRKVIETRAVEGTILNASVRFVSLEDLILLKNLALRGRTRKQDEVDLENLMLKFFDTDYVQSWKNKLKTA